MTQSCLWAAVSSSRYSSASLTFTAGISFLVLFLARPTNILSACFFASSLDLTLLARR